MPYDKCPSCHGLTEVGGMHCSCGWREHAPSDRPQADKAYDGSRYLVDKCQWNDRGARCDFRAIMQVNGTWYCREHAYKLANYGGMEGKRGNELPNASRLPCVERWHAQMKSYLVSGGHSVTHELVDGEVRQRAGPTLPPLNAAIQSAQREREPGDDDE